MEKHDHRHRRLLRTRGERPRRRRAAENGDELPPPHSITSSARALMSFFGALRLRCLSADEHDLAAGPGFKDLLMRAGRLGE